MPGGDHRRDEVRPDAGVAAFGGQGRGHRGDADAEREHAQRERDLGRRTAHHAHLLLQAERLDDAGDALGRLPRGTWRTPRRRGTTAPSRASRASLSTPASRSRTCTSLTSASRCCGVMPGRAEHAAPVAELDVDALLLQGGNAVQLLRARLRERAHLAGLDLLGELAEARDPGGDVAAEDRGDRLAAALERHVVDLRRVARRPPWRSGRSGCGRCRRPSRRPRTPCPGSP